MALHPSRPLVAVALGSGGVQMLELTGAGVAASPVPALQGSAVAALAFSPDGSVLAASSGADSPVVLLESDSRRPLAVLPPAAEEAGAAGSLRLQFMAGGMQLASQWAGGVAVYDLARGALAWVAQLPTTLLAVDPRSARLAVGTPQGSLVTLDAAGQPAGAQGLLHGHAAQAARFYAVPGGEGGAATTLLVLNESRQYAAAVPAAPAREFSGAARPRATGGQAKQLPAAAAAAVEAAPPVAAGLEQAASHLLAPATELAPLALEKLLLA